MKTERPVFVPYYYVVREYSGMTARKTLWKVLSRRMKDKLSATDWMDFERNEYKKKHPRSQQKFFIVTNMEQADEDYWKWYDLNESLKERALNNDYSGTV